MRNAIMAAVFAVSAAGPALAQDAAGDAAEGAVLYERHCATCHGLDGKGNGPMAGVLVVQPVDLTGLSAGEGGAFPLLRVVRRIDGRDPLVSHGSPMPVYGDYFDGPFEVAMKTDAGQPILTSQPVVDLVAYLREVQRLQ